MKLNLRRRTIFTKIFSGFMLILLLAVFMGGVLFYGLRGVNGVLARIVGQSIPSIKYSTAVERYALHAILDEKNYLLLEKKKIQLRAMEHLQAIYDNLDKVDEVAVKYDDRHLLEKSKDVRRAVEKYQDYYNRGVALLEENQAVADKMRILGRKVNELSHGHTLQHRELLKEAIAKGADQEKYMEGFHLATEIEKEALEARRQEKNYMIYKKQEHFDKLKEHIANLMKLDEEISKVAYAFEHRPLMSETRKLTEEYLLAAKKWVANDDELQDILSKMSEIGIQTQETALNVQEAGWQEMNAAGGMAVLMARRAVRTSILMGIIVLIAGSLSAFLITRGITRPIKELTQASMGLAKGDFSARVKIESGDEVGSLAGSFNQMAENLQTSQEEIQAQNEELSVSNEELRSSSEEIVAVNEELRMVVEKLRQTNEELAKFKAEFEQNLNDRTQEALRAKEELEKKLIDLEQFNKLAVGRELKMIEMKIKLAALEKKLEEKS